MPYNIDAYNKLISGFGAIPNPLISLEVLDSHVNEEAWIANKKPSGLLPTLLKLVVEAKPDQATLDALKLAQDEMIAARADYQKSMHKVRTINGDIEKKKQIMYVNEGRKGQQEQMYNIAKTDVAALNKKLKGANKEVEDAKEKFDKKMGIILNLEKNLAQRREVLIDFYKIQIPVFVAAQLFFDKSPKANISNILNGAKEVLESATGDARDDNYMATVKIFDELSKKLAQGDLEAPALKALFENQGMALYHRVRILKEKQPIAAPVLPAPAGLNKENQDYQEVSEDKLALDKPEGKKIYPIKKQNMVVYKVQIDWDKLKAGEYHAEIFEAIKAGQVERAKGQAGLKLLGNAEQPADSHYKVKLVGTGLRLYGHYIEKSKESLVPIWVADTRLVDRHKK